MVNKTTSILKRILAFVTSRTPGLWILLHILPQTSVIDAEKKCNLTRKAAKGFFSYLARHGKSNTVINKKKIITFNGKQVIMNLDVNEYTQCGYYFCISNPELIKLIKKGGEVMVDVGSNVGLFSLIGASFYKKVYSFEPTPHTRFKMGKNIKLSGIDNIILRPEALSEKPGELTLYENPMNQGGNTLEGFNKDYIIKSGKSLWRTHIVNVDTLDNILADEKLPIGLLKIDVEGHELSVIKGASRIIHHNEPILFVEVFDPVINKKIVEILPDTYLAMDPVSNKIIDPNENKWEIQNVLYVPKSKAETC